MPPSKSYFWELDKRMPRLEKLDLSYNNWLTNHSIQSLCKCQDLKEVSFRGCMRIGEVLAYTAIATRFGFRNVTKMDLRDTSIGDHELSCFAKLPKVPFVKINYCSSITKRNSYKNLLQRNEHIILFSADTFVGRTFNPNL